MSAQRRPPEPTEAEVHGWYRFRRGRLTVTPSAVTITTRTHPEQIAREQLVHIRCASGLLLDVITLTTHDRKVRFRAWDVADFASAAQRERFAPAVQLDADVRDSVEEIRGWEREDSRHAPGRTAAGGLEIAAFLQRAVARVVDLIMCLLLWFVLVIVLAQFDASDAAVVGFTIALVAAYEIPLTAFAGWTPGKRFAQLRVVAVRTGTPPGLIRAVVRTVLVWPTMILGRLRAVVPIRALAWVDGLHDRAAGTVVLMKEATRALELEPDDDRKRLLADAQRRQLAGLAKEEEDLAEALDGDG